MSDEQKDQVETVTLQIGHVGSITIEKDGTQRPTEEPAPPPVVGDADEDGEDHH